MVSTAVDVEVEQAQKLPARSCGQRTVLLIEDDAEVREALVELLGTFGHTVIGARNGAEALDYLRAHRAPCLILLDLMMPVMNGYQFRAQQVAIALLASIPVVLISAHSDLARDASSLEVADYLVKPIDMTRLLEVVARYC